MIWLYVYLCGVLAVFFLFRVFDSDDPIWRDILYAIPWPLTLPFAVLAVAAEPVGRWVRKIQGKAGE